MGKRTSKLLAVLKAATGKTRTASEDHGVSPNSGSLRQSQTSQPRVPTGPRHSWNIGPQQSIDPSQSSLSAAVAKDSSSGEQDVQPHEPVRETGQRSVIARKPVPQTSPAAPSGTQKDAGQPGALSRSTSLLQTSGLPTVSYPPDEGDLEFTCNLPPSKNTHKPMGVESETQPRAGFAVAAPDTSSSTRYAIQRPCKSVAQHVGRANLKLTGIDASIDDEEIRQIASLWYASPIIVSLNTAVLC